MLFYVYDSSDIKRGSVQADSSKEAIDKARSLSNRFPMVVPEREFKQSKDDSYHWQDSNHD